MGYDRLQRLRIRVAMRLVGWALRLIAPRPFRGYFDTVLARGFSTVPMNGVAVNYSIAIVDKNGIKQEFQFPTRRERAAFVRGMRVAEGVDPATGLPHPGTYNPNLS